MIFHDNHEILNELRECMRLIYRELREIRCRLEPRFTLRIYPLFHCGYDYEKGVFMAAITAGQSATFFLAATASDNSTPVLTNQALTASDPSVTIAPDTADTTGNTFTVTVPASDAATSFTLDAKAEVTSNTSTTPQTVTATLDVTISPASVPVTFTLTINEK